MKEEENLSEKSIKITKRLNFSRYSSLTLDLNKSVNHYFTDFLGYKNLPHIYFLQVYGIHHNFDRFGRFIRRNFPISVEHLHLTGYKVEFNQFPEREIELISQRVRSSIHLNNFKMTTRDVQTVMNANQHLKRISIHGTTLSEPEEELELEGDFKNIEEIILPKIGLSNRNIEHIGKSSVIYHFPVMIAPPLIPECSKISIVDHLITKDDTFDNKIIPNILNLNLYQKDDEDFLVELQKKLQQKGFKGNFKTLSNK